MTPDFASCVSVNPVFGVFAFVGAIETYGPLASSPSARLRMKARELRDTANELDQLAEYIA